MSTLMIAPEDSIVTLPQLQDMTPSINALHTHSHKPRPFYDVVTMAMDELERAGYHIGETQFVLARNQTQLFALLEILEFGENGVNKLAYAIRSSINKTLSEQHALSEILTICTNLCLWAKQFMGRKNTRFIERDIRNMIRGYVAQVAGLVEENNARQNRYRQAVLTDSLANHTIVRMFQADVINSTRMGKVITEYYQPSHVEHLNDNGDKTAWTLFNAVTESFKGSPIATLTERCDGLHTQVGNATDYALRNQRVVSVQ
jgi:hypothetical protein